MSLAVTILWRITIIKEGRFPERLFMPLLLAPLMRRLQAHRTDASRVQQIVQLALEYLQRREHARAQFSLDNQNVIGCIAYHWSYAPSLFNRCLVDFIGLLRSGTQRALFCYQRLIHQVPKRQRYDLVMIVCLNSTDIRTNIGSDEGLRSTLIEKWPIFIFMMLQRNHSLTLLQNLIRVKLEANFLELRSQHITFSDQPLEETILARNLRRQSCSLTRCAVAEVLSYGESSSCCSTETLAPWATHPVLNGSY